MEPMEAIAMLGALAHPTRLRVVAELARHTPDGLSVGEIATIVDTPQNTMSAHLAILSRAGVLTGKREGRVVRYSIVTDGLQRLAEYLAVGLSPRA